ncbi:MAG: hypothetical protein ACT4QE_18485 [Anaerolineales bacterium]
MTEILIPLPPDLSHAQIEYVIEQACAAAGLRLTLKGMLKQYPGCIHWHFKLGEEPGTLEITYWPREQRAWFKVARGRSGDWIAPLLPRLKRAIRRAAGR